MSPLKRSSFRNLDQIRLDNATNRLYYGIVPYHNIIMLVWSDCVPLTRCADFYAFKDARCSSAHNRRRIAAGMMPELRRCVVGMGTITIALSLLLTKDTGRKKEIFFSRTFLAFFPRFLKTGFHGKSQKSLVRDYYNFCLYCDSLNVSQQIIQQINDFFPIISHEIA